MQIDKMLSAISLPPDDPAFLSHVFLVVANARKEAEARDGDNLRRVCSEEYATLSQWVDRTRLQESCSVRNNLRTRRIANLLINDKGELNQQLLPSLIKHLTEHLYSLAPEGQYDSVRQEHLLNGLKQLQNSKELVSLLRKIGRPHSHPLAEQVIRDTLQLPEGTLVTDAHARRAALSAMLCYLRQNVGSCFATAPAILVHTEQTELFLADLDALINTGRLKRTFGGIEYAVPISSTWGAGDLRKPVLLMYGLPSGEIWTSPGIIAALEAVNILPKEASIEEKFSMAKTKVLAALPQWNENQSALLTTADAILRNLLMQHLSLTPSDIEQYTHRPREMMHGGLLMQVSSHSGVLAGKGEASAKFFELMEVGRSAFKGLTENALLRTWEYSLASFAETKSTFARWNLYSSLGFASNSPGGVGECIYNILQQKVEFYNQKANDLQFEYEQLYGQLKHLEARSRHLESQQQAQWVSAEYRSKAQEFYTLEDMRTDAHEKAKLLANLFEPIMECYDRLFPTYFQEVYDADLQEISVGPYDDSPAGFRLLFKHGRSNTSQWTRIKNPDEFVEALAQFFLASETELAAMPDMEVIRNEITEIITALVQHVRTPLFLETAFQRMAAIHNTPLPKNPLSEWDKVPIKPWAYVSGGTMHHLVSCYFNRTQDPSESARWVENPMELLVFFVDTVRQIPSKTLEMFNKNPQKSLLIHSPTHAFLFKPGSFPFCKSWQTDGYTYTWVRDQLVEPLSAFVSEIRLDSGMVEYLLHRLVQRIPPNYQPYFKRVFSDIQGPIDLADFRDYLVSKMNYERGLQYGGDNILSTEEIDSLLYQLWPLFPINQLNERLKAIWERLPGLTEKIKRQLSEALEKLTDRYLDSRYLGASSLQEICAALLCIVYKRTSLPVDMHAAITAAAQELGFAMPRPIIFADSNWNHHYFAMVVNPGTRQLDLWRVDATGREGSPMLTWKHWLDGTRKEPQWGIYISPEEYTYHRLQLQNRLT